MNKLPEGIGEIELTRINFEKAGKANFVIDAIYEAGTAKNLGAEVLSKLIPGIGNAGGFRYVGKNDSTPLVVLFSNGNEPNWPDELDPYRGTFQYYGDNRSPGRELHDTKKKGNEILRNSFQRAHGDNSDRMNCPIFLIFEGTGEGHNVIFKGLAVPGASHLQLDEDLIALWRVSNGVRFQNYRAIFTILDAGEINGDWIREIAKNKKVDWQDARVPEVLQDWVQKRIYTPLVTEKFKEPRTKEMQIPSSILEKELIQAIHDFCGEDDFLFEAIAIRIWEDSVGVKAQSDQTRRYRDGGRDAVGKIFIGPNSDPIEMHYSLEAKHYSGDNGVGVKELSRLISRIKHREFGVLVTTSFVSKQAYEEIRNDKHPIVVIAGSDIAKILLTKGINSKEACKKWLESVPNPHKFHRDKQTVFEKSS